MAFFGISIHALLAESDTSARLVRLESSNFYPRSPCGERLPQQSSRPRAALFLSTLSLRRATFTCGASTNNVNISIHALLAESDQSGNPSWIPFQQFLSTLSLRRATLPPHKQKRRNWISIHALLAESDLSMPSGNTNSLNFYPRSPCGERQSFFQQAADITHFYPRSPCGERLFECR